MNAFLKIKSTNPDLCGFWHASDVEAELIDLEIPLKNDTTWIEYIISRVFMDEDYAFPPALEECIKLFKDSMFKAKFKLGDDLIELNYSIC